MSGVGYGHVFPNQGNRKGQMDLFTAVRFIAAAVVIFYLLISNKLTVEILTAIVGGLAVPTSKIWEVVRGKNGNTA